MSASCGPARIICRPVLVAEVKIALSPGKFSHHASAPALSPSPSMRHRSRLLVGVLLHRLLGGNGDFEASFLR